MQVALAMMAFKVPAIVCQNNSRKTQSAVEYLQVVGAGFPVLLHCYDVVPQQAQLGDYREGKVLVGVKQHRVLFDETRLARFVVLNRAVNFFAISRRIFPGRLQIGGRQSGDSV